MKDYVRKTLEKINDEITELEALRDGLERYLEKDAEEPVARSVVPSSLPRSDRAQKKSTRKRCQKVRAADLEETEGEDGPIRIGSMQHKVLVEARKLAEPFTVEKIATTAGIAKPTVGVTINTLAHKGLIEEVGKDGMKKTYVIKNG